MDIEIKKEDYAALQAEESTIDTLLQCGLFQTYFPDIADKMLEAKRGVYSAIENATVVDTH
jgi:hypothetical protein